MGDRVVLAQMMSLRSPAPSSHVRRCAEYGEMILLRIAALAAIVGSGLDPERQLILLLVYNICFVAPLIAIIVTLTVARDESERVLARTLALLQKHWPVLLAGLALFAGAFVTLLGATGLAGGGHGSVARVSRRLRHILSR